MDKPTPYPIGRPGVPWRLAERKEWLDAQSVKRSYADEVLKPLAQLGATFVVTQYGALSIAPARYPLMVVRAAAWDAERRTVLITGGVHGYETSGVQGAIRFLQTHAEHYAKTFNVIVAPCVSPWGYETINRWNPGAFDPNRSFHADSPSEEAALLMTWLSSQSMDLAAHIDLHETTDTDNLEFRPALSARDGKHQAIWGIPDGFYTVGDTQKPTPEFQKAIIDSVERVTHIAPAAADNTIIGEVCEQWGVISYAGSELGLCMGVTDAPYVTTTEVYPDSPNVDGENCILAQVAAVTGGLDFVIEALARDAP